MIKKVGKKSGRDTEKENKTFYGGNIISGILTVSILAIYILLQSDLISSFESLPSPLYGGDYYYQLGGVYHIYRGGNPTYGSSTIDSLPGYFILYSFLVAWFAIISSLEPMKAMLYFSHLILISAIIIYYYLSYLLLKNRYVALIVTLIFIPLTKFPVIKYTEFTQFVMMPLFFIALFTFIKNMNYKTGLFLGVTMGLASISHSSAFISVYLTFSLAMLYFSRLIWLKCEGELGINASKIDESLLSTNIPKMKIILSPKKFKKFIRNNFRYIFLVFILSFAIAQLYWFDPIFIHHGKTRPHYIEWAGPDYTNPSVQSSVISSRINSACTIAVKPFNVILNPILTSISTPLGDLILLLFGGLLMIMGLVFLITSEKTPEKSYLILLLIVVVISEFHYFITLPLFHIHFVPHRIVVMLFSPIIPLLAGCSLIFISSKLEKYASYFLVVLVILTLINNVTSFERFVNKDRWINAGKKPIPAYLDNLSKFVIRDTEIDDVFLTTNELGFALNALTGAKLLTTRRAQSDPFMDMDSRVLAAAIILYGNNTNEKIDLIKKYKIKYLYWDYYWVQSEYHFDDQGRLIGWFDPLILFDTLENRKVLERYNISYFQQYTWVDPALRGSDKYKKFDLLFISPRNYRSFDRPWKSDLDKYLEEVWNYTYQGQKIAVLYRIETQ